MADKNYEVFEVYCDYIDFNLLVLRIPEEDLEDKLTYFAKEKGRIPKTLYDEFLITTCISNINQVIHKIQNDDVYNKLDYFKLWNLIVEIILDKNPKLDYDNVIINKNYVLKIREDNIELKPGERLLMDNDYWLSINFEEEDNDEENIDKDPTDEVSFKVKKKWWKRIGKYVNVKVFDAKDLPKLVGSRYFHSTVTFNNFVVSLCIEDFEDLFQLLDNMGIPSRVSPPLLVKELYDLCKSCNPFLTHENAQKFYDKSNKKTVHDNKDESNTASVGSSTMKQYTNKLDKKKKTFKDVPEEDLLSLGTNMKVSLIGQDRAIDTIVEAIQRASVGLKDPVKPIGSFLFAGSTGSGKTLTSKVLADELIKDRDNLVTIDCSEYAADHEYSKLIGAPQGYQGYEQGGYLTNKIMENPFSIVVFDELEKASKKIFNLLLQILDEGRLTSGKGEEVSFKDTIIIMTSNIGVNSIKKIGKTIGFGDVSKVTPKKKEKAIEEALKRRFKPEFLNRIDEVVYFNDLTKKDYERIIDIELYKLNDNLQRNDTKFKDITLDFDDKIKKYVYNKGINKEYGARPLKRAIERYIATPLAVTILKEKVHPKSLIHVSCNKGKATFEITKEIASPPKFMKIGK